MRYTLRLLTSQQFQRATALVCAAELAAATTRRPGASEPFRIGLWVGTDVSARSGSRRPTRSSRSVNDGRALPADRAADPALPLVRHPDRAGATSGPIRRQRRVYVYCGDDAGRVPVRRGRRRRRRAAGPHRRRGDLPARAGVRDRHRRQVRPAGPGGRGGRAVRLRAPTLRPARLRPPGLPPCEHARTAASTTPKDGLPAAARASGGPAAARRT